MYKFPIHQYKKFADLPLENIETFKYSVYLLTFEWDYLFVNRTVRENLKERGGDLIGKNLWREFPELKQEPQFIKMKLDLEEGRESNLTILSPVLNQRIQVLGHQLEDCFYCSSSVLPDKENLLNELRTQLGKKLSK